MGRVQGPSEKTNGLLQLYKLGQGREMAGAGQGDGGGGGSWRTHFTNSCQSREQCFLCGALRSGTWTRWRQADWTAAG